jgi:hypothetical protein
VPLSIVVPAPPAPPDEAPDLPFSADFADLQAAIAPRMGQALEEEHPLPDDPDGCSDVQQRTSTGLAYIGCATGLASFVADPDGMYHWSWLGDRLAAWIGPQIDPPDVSLATDLPVCVGPAPDPATACPLRPDVPVAGFLVEPGQSDTYRLNVLDPSTDVIADLTNLPADYDLFLVDDAGAVRAESMQEGTSPEHVEQPLPTGTYYLYVHVDPARAADPDQPYKLLLTEQAPPASADSGGATPPPADVSAN